MCEDFEIWENVGTVQITLLQQILVRVQEIEAELLLFDV